MKRAMNRGQRNLDGSGNNNFTSKKIFVGGLSSNLTEEEFKNYFERFGRITDVVVMHDSATRRPRGFGFITFESEESVEHVMQNNFYELNGKRVEVKRAVPKEANNNNKNGYNMRMGGGRGSSFPLHGQNLPYAPAPGYEIFPGYFPYSGYGCIENYCYAATSMYPGGYCMGENAGIDYGRTPFQHPWNGPGSLGSAIMYPPYSSGRNMVAGSSNGLVGPRTSSRSQAEATPTPSQNDSSLEDANGNFNPPSLVLNNSVGGKLGMVCNGEAPNSAGENSGPHSLKDDGAVSSPLKEDGSNMVCNGEAPNSAGENSGPHSLKDDGAVSSPLKEDGSEFSSHLKVDCAASPSDSKDDGTVSPSDSFDGAASPDTKDDGVASSSDSYDNGSTCSLNTSTDNLACNGAASNSSYDIQNQNDIDEQLKPSPDCDSS